MLFPFHLFLVQILPQFNVKKMLPFLLLYVLLLLLLLLSLMGCVRVMDVVIIIVVVVVVDCLIYRWDWASHIVPIKIDDYQGNMLCENFNCFHTN